MTKALWLALADFVFSMVLYFCGKYLAPDYFEDVKFVIAIAQVLIAAILAHFYGAEIKALIRAYFGRQ